MGFLNLFSKEIECDICKNKLKKVSAYGFDSTIRGRRDEGEKLKLCRECFFDKSRSAIENFKGKAVFYRPTKDKNAYHFYNFTEYINHTEDSDSCEEFPPIKSYKIIPKTDEKCKCCGQSANFTWCESESYEQIDTYNVSSIPNELINIEYLCSQCLIDKFTEVVEKEDIVLSEYFPPTDHDGIAISGEC